MADGYQFDPTYSDMMPNVMTMPSKGHAKQRYVTSALLDRIIGEKVNQAAEQAIVPILSAFGVDLPASTYGSGTFQDMIRGQRTRSDLSVIKGKMSSLDSRLYDSIANRINQATGADFTGEGVGNMMKYGGGALGAFLGVDVDQFTGGLPSDLAAGLYHAGRGMRGGTQYLTMNDIKDVVTRMNDEARRGDGSLNYEYTRGFTMGEMGEIAQQMVGRGSMLYDSASPEGKAMQVEKNIKDTMDTLQVLKDVMGNPDASVQELFKQLDDTFGPQSSLKAQLPRMQATLKSAEALAGQLGITTQQALSIVGGTSARWAAGGGNAAVGATTGILSLEAIGAYQKRNASRSSYEADSVANMTSSELQGAVVGMHAHLQSSEVGRNYAALQTIIEDGYTPKTPEAARIADIMRRTHSGNTTAEERDYLYGALNSGQIFGVANQFGVNSTTFDNIRNDPTMADVYKRPEMQRGSMDVALAGMNRSLAASFAGMGFKGTQEELQDFSERARQVEGSRDAKKIEAFYETEAARLGFPSGRALARSVSAGVNANFADDLASGKSGKDAWISAGSDTAIARETAEETEMRRVANDATRHLNPSVTARNLEQMLGRAFSAWLGGESDIGALANTAAGVVTDEQINEALDKTGFNRDIEQIEQNSAYLRKVDEAVKLEREMETADPTRKAEIQSRLAELDVGTGKERDQMAMTAFESNRKFAEVYGGFMDKMGVASTYKDALSAAGKGMNQLNKDMTPTNTVQALSQIVSSLPKEAGGSFQALYGEEAGKEYDAIVTELQNILEAMKKDDADTEGLKQEAMKALEKMAKISEGKTPTSLSRMSTAFADSADMPGTGGDASAAATPGAAAAAAAAAEPAKPKREDFELEYDNQGNPYWHKKGERKSIFGGGKTSRETPWDESNPAEASGQFDPADFEWSDSVDPDGNPQMWRRNPTTGQYEYKRGSTKELEGGRTAQIQEEFRTGVMTAELTRNEGETDEEYARRKRQAAFDAPGSQPQEWYQKRKNAGEEIPAFEPRRKGETDEEFAAREKMYWATGANDTNVVHNVTNAERDSYMSALGMERQADGSYKRKEEAKEEAAASSPKEEAAAAEPKDEKVVAAGAAQPSDKPAKPPSDAAAGAPSSWEGEVEMSEGGNNQRVRRGTFKLMFDAAGGYS